MEAARRRMLQRLIAGGALAAGGGFGGFGIHGVIREALAKGSLPMASGIHSLRGSVKINGKPAQVGDPLLRGDSVSTGADGQAVLVIERDAFLLRENTQVTFGADVLKQVFRLFTGKILSVFAQGEHRILAPTASIGIRGTACYLEAIEAERIYFCLCYGETDVETSGGIRADYRTTHHDSPRYVYADGMVAAPMLMNHSDAELIMLEGLEGRYPPFYRSGSVDY